MPVDGRARCSSPPAAGIWSWPAPRPRRGSRLTDDPPENSCRPAADVLFRSAARLWGAGTLGVVLTGMGRDGLAGSRAVVEAGGSVIAQDEFSSVVWGMPGEVVRAGLADAVLPLAQIGVEIALRLGETAAADPGQSRHEGRRAAVCLSPALLRKRTGVVIDDSKQYLVVARMLPIVRQRKIPSIETLLDRVRQGIDPTLERDVLNAMMTHETSFFRDMKPFDTLRQLITELMPKRVGREAAGDLVGRLLDRPGALQHRHAPERAFPRPGGLLADPDPGHRLLRGGARPGPRGNLQRPRDRPGSAGRRSSRNISGPCRAAGASRRSAAGWSSFGSST